MAVVHVGKRGDGVKESCLLGAARSPLQGGLLQQSSAQQISFGWTTGEKSLSQSGCSCSSSALHHHLPGKFLKFKIGHFNSLDIFSVDFLPMDCTVPVISGGWPGLIEGDCYQ